jgi:hypothetical protein
MTQTQTESVDGGRGGLVRSSSVAALLRRHRDGGPLTSGAVVQQLFDAHLDYLEKEVVPGIYIPDAGPRRTVVEHLEVAERRWDPALTPKLTGRHVVLALAMDDGVGWRLLQSGVVASLVARWPQGPGTAKEPRRLVWDVLSDDGRAHADDQPLLAAALGAPAEWSVDLPAAASMMAWSPAGDQVAVLAGGTVYEAAPQHPVNRVNDVDEHVISLGWGQRDGIVALRVHDGVAQFTRVSSESVLWDVSGATGGRLSGDGSQAWLELTDGVARRSQREPQPARLGPSPGCWRWTAAAGTGWSPLVGTRSSSPAFQGTWSLAWSLESRSSRSGSGRPTPHRSSAGARRALGRARW